MKRRYIVICVILILVVINIIIIFNKNNEKRYSLEILQSMPDKELYELFVNKGMRVHKDFEENLSEEERIDLFIENFNSIIYNGYSPIKSFIGYKNMSEDIQRIYKELINVK